MGNQKIILYFTVGFCTVFLAFFIFLNSHKHYKKDHVLTVELLNELGFSKKQQELLKDLEGNRSKFFNISRETANFLNLLVTISKAKNVVEVGTSNGYSSIWIAEALKKTGGHLTTIDKYPQRLVLAKENFKQFNVDNIITIKQGNACDILKTIDFKIDFAFIDAKKPEYEQYFDLIDKNLKKGGIIVADNIISHDLEVAPFVNKITSDKDYQVEIVDLSSGLLIAYKLN